MWRYRWKSVKCDTVECEGVDSVHGLISPMYFFIFRKKKNRCRVLFTHHFIQIDARQAIYLHVRRLQKDEMRQMCAKDKYVSILSFQCRKGFCVKSTGHHSFFSAVSIAFCSSMFGGRCSSLSLTTNGLRALGPTSANLWFTLDDQRMLWLFFQIVFNTYWRWVASSARTAKRTSRIIALSDSFQ